MYQSFWVDSKNVETVKGLVRQHPSLRFVANPLTVGNSAQFCLEGEVEDFNDLNIQLEGHPQVPPALEAVGAPASGTLDLRALGAMCRFAKWAYRPTPGRLTR